MDQYVHRIVLDKGNTGHAYVSGTIDELSFYVVVHKIITKKALSFNHLDLGEGNIERLLLYSEDTDFEGNPYTPSMTIKRNVYAEFHEGWLIFNPAYTSYVTDLVHYFKQRCSIHSV